jgi:hypothetical protein
MPCGSNIRLDTTHPPGYAFNMVGMVIPLFGLLDGYDVLGMFHR